MKLKLLFAVLIAGLFALPALASDLGEYYTSGVITNPTAGQLLVQTAAFDDGGSESCVTFKATVGSTVNAIFRIAAWNGTAEVKPMPISVLANQPFNYGPDNIAFCVPTGYSLRISMQNAVTGTVGASLSRGLYVVH